MDKTNAAPVIAKSNAPAQPAIVPAPKVASVKPARPALLDGDIIKAARAAIEKGDMEAVSRAYEFFLAYIKEHPENIDEYVAAFSNEANEHILRALTRAMADAEAGLLENEKVMKSAVELAKDTSFEQRQHIMLHLMSQFPQMNEEAHQALLELSRNDPNSQVKTSAVAALADWMDKFPEQTGPLLGQLGEIFKNTKDEDVRVFAYQVLALHKESLTRDLQVVLGERLKLETESFNGNLIAAALSIAPDDIRLEAINYVQSRFGKEKDEETRRNLLAQIVALGRQDSLPLLTTCSKGDSLLAQDARDYIALVSSNQPYDVEQIFQQKSVRDGQNPPKEVDPAPHP
ncbi:MAG: hypothetical protein JWM68_2168 [Verrucomicrobiales bacterium]|nr:hypothetical protein [Verrucomicrobiales bacterium]